ncbi:pre-60S ribosomal particles component [Coemansia sp. RSA 2050]|nr:pre-60S ribosomal particles component [Coemansia sp. RSA 2050]KAJ2732656.1 pre-60S ribosomal particles component [Coemansia sp. BCRC 34962]
MALTAKKPAGISKPKGKFTAKMAKPAIAPKDKAESDQEEEFNDDSDLESASSLLASDSAMDVTQSEAESDYNDLAKARKLATKRNTKRGKTADADEFSNVLAAILAQDSRDANAPIMAKDRTRENQIREELINYRARKALVDEKRQLLNKDRVIPTLENFDYERKLRKVATRGVIKLFNVIKAQQTELTHITKTPTTRTEKVAEMSKSKFLDLLKAKTS